MDKSWETPPRFSITERQWGFAPSWGAAAVSLTPGLALRETSARRGRAHPRADTSPGFLFVNSALGFPQPIR